LLLNQVDEIVDEQQVPDLLAPRSIADVAKGSAEVVAQYPVSEDTLVDLPHLPWASDYPAAVDDSSEAEGVGVLDG
jgi:hypothetical protein